MRGDVEHRALDSFAAAATDPRLRRAVRRHGHVVKAAWYDLVAYAHALDRGGRLEDDRGPASPDDFAEWAGYTAEEVALVFDLFASLGWLALDSWTYVLVRRQSHSPRGEQLTSRASGRGTT